MKTKTAQPLEKQTSGQILLRAIRFRSPDYSKNIEPAPDDVALDVAQLGRDLVRNVFDGRCSDKTSDGRCVDVVSRNGQKLRVFTRLVRRNSGKPSLTARAHSVEVSPINYSKESDKPDAVVLVAVRPDQSTVDIFKFPLEEFEGRKVAKGSYSVTWSERKQTYGKYDKNIFYSYKGKQGR